MFRSRPTLGAYLVGAYLFSVPAFGYSDTLGLLIIPQVTGALLLGYAVFDILGSLRTRIPYEVRLYGFMCLWAAITFTLGASTSEWKPLGSLVKVVLATLACAQLIKNEADLFTALKIFVFSVLLVYFQNKSDLQYLRMADQIQEMERFAGTLANANNAAIFSLTVIWASLLVVLRSGRRLLNGAWFVVPIGISLLIIYYSGSKKGLIGVGLFMLFLTRLLYMHQRSLYRRGAIVLVSVFLLIMTGYFVYISPYFFRMQQLFYGGSGSDIKRLELVLDATKVWLMNWKTFFMGVGYDNFRLFNPLQDYAHSTPFELLASNGLIGFLLFMGFLFVLVRKFVFLQRHTPDPQLKSLFFMSLVFLFIFSFFMLAAVLHGSRELLPILGSLAAFGQIHLRLLGQSLPNGSPGFTQ